MSAMKENPRKIVPKEDFETARLSRKSREGEKPRHPYATGDVIDFDKVKVQREAEKVAAETKSGLVSGEGAAFTWQDAAALAQSVLDRQFIDNIGIKKTQEEKDAFLAQLESQRGIVASYSTPDLVKVLRQYRDHPADFHQSYIRAISEDYLRRYNVLQKA